jgi:hypothetical protein
MAAGTKKQLTADGRRPTQTILGTGPAYGGTHPSEIG